MEAIDITAVGHALVDIRFIVDRFPGPDEEAVIIKRSYGAGGSAANVAIDIRRLGLKSAIIAKVGFDSFGRLIVDELMKEGVDVSGLRIGFKETGSTTVVINSSGRILMYGFKGASEDLKPDEIDTNLISRSKYIHIASLRPDTSIRVASIAKEYNKIVSWDPGRVLAREGVSKLKELIKLVDIVLANEHECIDLTKISDYKEAARKIIDLGPNTVVVKRGHKGIYVVSDEYTGEMPAFKIEKPVDTTGAGDAFAAGLLTGLARGYDFKKSLIYALAVAALKVSRLGSHEVPSHNEVIKFIWEAKYPI